MADKIEIPEAPGGLPAAVQKKWKATYESAFREAQDDYPEDIITQKQTALREANKTLRFADPKTYDEAMALESWHVVLRAPSDDGKTLRVVTRHGKKFTFPIPEKKQNPPAANPPAA
jgi:hypothetical protein